MIEQFIGTWKLVSAQYRRANGEAIEIYGENPVGMLMYDANRYMSVQIMRRNRPNFAAADRLGGTPEQIQAAFRGYLAYFGRYTIDKEQKRSRIICKARYCPTGSALTKCDSLNSPAIV